MSRKCITGDWNCIYHACMSDECQREQVQNTDLDWGHGNCTLPVDNGTTPGVYDTCPRCGEWFDDADYDFQTCHVCGWSNNQKPE